MPLNRRKTKPNRAWYGFLCTGIVQNTVRVLLFAWQCDKHRPYTVAVRSLYAIYDVIVYHMYIEYNTANVHVL